MDDMKRLALANRAIELQFNKDEYGKDVIAGYWIGLVSILGEEETGKIRTIMKQQMGDKSINIDSLH